MKSAQLSEKNTMFGPMFIKVGMQEEGTGTISVQDIVPEGANVPNGLSLDVPKNCLYLQKLTKAGAADGATLYWRNCTTKRGSRDVVWYGWYSEEDANTSPNTMTFKPGEAAWLYVPVGSELALRVAGEVPNGNMYFAINDGGNSAICNPMPAVIPVQDIQPVSADPAQYPIPNGLSLDVPKNCLYLQKLTNVGAADGATLYWRDCTTKRGSRDVIWFGWYSEEDANTSPNAMTFNPGEGAWLYNPAEMLTLVYQGVIGGEEE